MSVLIDRYKANLLLFLLVIRSSIMDLASSTYMQVSLFSFFLVCPLQYTFR
jgi:hypothetical protein